ncbi:MAG: hypothetical protein LBS02_17910 [Hungatella sp.]|jgi:hypothetical protein|nr:hypothetical protein [Hungatella sp.]
MTNIERLKLELSHKNYFTDEEYNTFLEENSLTSTEIYNKKEDELFLLQTVIAILQALTNNIDLYRTIETEFTNTTSAYKNLKDRIDELYKRISLIPNYQPTAKVITYLYHN